MPAEDEGLRRTLEGEPLERLVEEIRERDPVAAFVMDLRKSTLKKRLSH